MPVSISRKVLIRAHIPRPHDTFTRAGSQRGKAFKGREVRRKWGKVLLVTDNASQHKHREVLKYLEEHDGLEILYLPTAMPKLSAVGSVWKDAKYRLVTSEHYETLEDLTHAVSEYFRTCSIRLDIYKFLYRCV